PLARGSPTRSRTNGQDQGQRTGTARPFPLWRLRSGLCCRPSIQYSGVASPQARIFIQHSGLLSGSAFYGPDPHCLTLCDPFATYRRVTRSPGSTICRCITGAMNTEYYPSRAGLRQSVGADLLDCLLSGRADGTAFNPTAARLSGGRGQP